MIVEETVNKLIRDTIDLLLSSPGYTIKAKQKDAPRPIGDYADVDFLTSINVGLESKSLRDNDDDPDLTEKIEGLREITMSLSFYRSSPMDVGRQVHIGLLRESVLSLFNAANIGLLSRTDVREISDPLENGWEKRAQFDIVLSAIGTDEDIVRSIETATISGESQFRGSKDNFNIEV